MFNGLQHTCIEGDHIVNIFSFSKAYGMMGWRVGYVRLDLGSDYYFTSKRQIIHALKAIFDILNWRSL